MWRRHTSESNIICIDIWNKFSKPRNVEPKRRLLATQDLLLAFLEINEDLTIPEINVINGMTTYRKWQNGMQSAFGTIGHKLNRLHTYCLKNIDRANIKLDKINLLCCYQWRLRHFNSAQIELLVPGYIKQESKVFIPVDIIGILVNYTYDSINIVKKIKKIGHKETMDSEIFEYKSCKFQFELYPTRNELKLRWLDAPKHVDEVEIKGFIGFMERYQIISISEIFCEKGVSNVEITLDIRDVLQYLESFTFNLLIQEFTAYDESFDEIMLSSEERIAVSDPITPMIVMTEIENSGD